MVLRYHRVAAALRCWKLAFNQLHRGYDRENDWNLADGSALHAGVAYGRSSGNWEAAADFSIGHLIQHVPPGEEAYFADHATIVRTCVERYAEATAAESKEVRLIAPELEFEAPLPNSNHHCLFKHWHEAGRGSRYDQPHADDILREAVLRHQCPECFSPHYVAGRTDAVTEEDGQLWIDEYKTTSIFDDTFWGEFLLDQQITFYCYGVWKTIGVMPKGVIVHAFYKPSAKQVASWNSRRKVPKSSSEVNPSLDKSIADYIKYDRQRFTRDEDDLLRFEHDMKTLGDEWENRVINNRFPMSNVKGICTQYRRLCEFHLACLNHDRLGFETLTRQADPERLRLYHIGEVAA